MDQDTHRALQVQIHRKTPRVDWIGQLRTLKMRVSLPDSLSLSSGHSSRSAGSSPQKDASSGLDSTNQDTKDLG